MQTMYPAVVNSPSTEVLFHVDDSTSEIVVRDVGVIPSPPNLLTIGYDTPNPETVRLISISDNVLIVERGFEGNQSSWDVNTKVARVFTAYDFFAFKYNIENIEVDEQSFTVTDIFRTNDFIYFVGDLRNGWKVNRYDSENLKAVAEGTANKPITLEECEGLIYEEI